LPAELADVCIVGGGPAGLTAALTLGSAGREVVLVESGGDAQAAGVQELNDGDVEGEPYAGLDRTRYRALGGTANMWNVRVEETLGAKYVALAETDLADWPLGLDELEPFYADAQVICGLGAYAYDAAQWVTPGRQPFELDGTGLTNRIYQFGGAEQFARTLAADVRALPSVTVVTATTAVGMTPTRDGSGVEAVRAVGTDRQPFDLKARAFILACGAVENARLLLLAELDQVAGSDWVGRCFMEHARDFRLALVPDPLGDFAAAAFYDAWVTGDGTRVGGHLALTGEAVEQLQLPNAALTLVPRARGWRALPLAARAPAAVRRALDIPSGRYGWSALRSPEAVFDRFDLVVNLEHRPDRRNRIDLSDRRDRFGNQLPRLHLEWTPREQDDLERLRGLLGEWLRVAGLGRLVSSARSRPDLNAHHHAGTTRMASDPSNGVVDSAGRVFGLENLYLTGAGVFPSAGYANPTLTIVALARRLGRHLDATLGS